MEWQEEPESLPIEQPREQPREEPAPAERPPVLDRNALLAADFAMGANHRGPMGMDLRKIRK